ncbi:unnamed protein product [Closterium sp. NIES-54]
MKLLSFSPISLFFPPPSLHSSPPQACNMELPFGGVGDSSTGQYKVRCSIQLPMKPTCLHHHPLLPPPYVLPSPRLSIWSSHLAEWERVARGGTRGATQSTASATARQSTPGPSLETWRLASPPARGEGR